MIFGCVLLRGWSLVDAPGFVEDSVLGGSVVIVCFCCVFFGSGSERDMADIG